MAQRGGIRRTQYGPHGHVPIEPGTAAQPSQQGQRLAEADTGRKPLLVGTCPNQPAPFPCHEVAPNSCATQVASTNVLGTENSSIW
ncbi:hypothetical protein VTN77DRAFT_504 [Rasamsonia byssochlamydoides]|uniref:uncharacterized protein n=1 Tax=Rasamsonia byssochlamydoides TaxID=89139 RepID=UPI0037445F4E